MVLILSPPEQLAAAMVQHPEGVITVALGVGMEGVVQQLILAIHLQAAVERVGILEMVAEAAAHQLMLPLVQAVAVAEHMVVLKQEVVKPVVVA